MSNTSLGLHERYFKFWDIVSCPDPQFKPRGGFTLTFNFISLRFNNENRQIYLFRIFNSILGTTRETIPYSNQSGRPVDHPHISLLICIRRVAQADDLNPVCLFTNCLVVLDPVCRPPRFKPFKGHRANEFERFVIPAQLQNYIGSSKINASASVSDKCGIKTTFVSSQCLLHSPLIH